ncbi:MAG TPA: protein kinase [Pirellulales bacterium]|nr:protein kinase [Pirellulales bacterium]
MATINCPDIMALQQFAIGDLAEGDFGGLAEHIEHCDECQTTLDQLTREAEPLLAPLRRLAGAAIEAMPPAGEAGGQSKALDSFSLTACECPLRLGKFELLEELGSGSYGVVFRARDTELDRLVAIKLLRAGRLASRAELERFLREARSAAQLKHPGIVSLYEIGQTAEGSSYLIEEFVEGITLADRLEKGRLLPRQAAELIALVADALDYAHRHGVIHRDIKPSNILLDGGGQPHLMDFGLAKRDIDDTPVTPEGEVLGTPAYLSPEQAAGDSQGIDSRCDVYSLGVVLYEALTGERPFRGNRRMLLLQVLEDEPRPPRRLNDRIPRDLETICLRAMAKSPARRYQTAGELADDLRRYLRGDAILARPIGRAERLKHWCRRNPLAASLLVAVSVGAVAGLWHLSALSERLVRSSALDSAAQVSEMLVIVNEDYSKIVDRLYPQKIEVTHDYVGKPQAIPLPATQMIDLGKHISEKSALGMRVRLFSDHPFKTRKDGGAKDGFERDALGRLVDNPDQPYWNFEDVENRPSLRYATARRMEATCVRCHNEHRDSPKKDWKVGDIAGVLEIVRPLDKDVARARQGLRGTFLLMTGICGSLLAVSVVSLVVSNRRRRRLATESSSNRA